MKGGPPRRVPSDDLGPAVHDPNPVMEPEPSDGVTQKRCPSPIGLEQDQFGGRPLEGHHQAGQPTP